MKTEATKIKFEKRRIVGTFPTPANRISAVALKKELNSWLEQKSSWTHNDWLSLLSDLRSKGYNDLIDTPKGQEAIGMYLEANRKVM